MRGRLRRNPLKHLQYTLKTYDTHWNTYATHWNICATHWNARATHWNTRATHWNTYATHCNTAILNKRNKCFEGKLLFHSKTLSVLDSKVHVVFEILVTWTVNSLFSLSLIYLTKVRIADVVRFVDSFQEAVTRSKLDKGYKLFLTFF